MKTQILLLTLIACNCSLAQWSTLTDAVSALYVCPGFTPNILSLDDGSSYVAGGLSDYIFVQKLDPRGYKLWPQPVQVFNTSGTENYSYTMVPDGTGGLLFVWKDYRGAYYVGDPASPANNALYMQRIDKNGNVVWQQNGIQVAPVDGGNKEATIVNDGAGGAVIMLGENDFERPESPKKEWIWLRHYGNDGTMLWNLPIDSSISSNTIYPPSGLVRMDSLIRFTKANEFQFISYNGIFVNSLKYKVTGSLVVVTDSSAYEIRNLPDETDSLGNKLYVASVVRLTSKWDSLWSTHFEIPDEADQNRGYYNIENPYVSDGNDGLFFLWSFIDKSGQKRARLQHITPQGAVWQNYGLNLSGNYGLAIFSGKNEAGIFFENGTAQKFNSDGQGVWQDSMIVLADPANAFFKVFASDNNGGLIIAFWTTAGGIFAQHTGRTGHVGLITKVKDLLSPIPQSFELYQNFPNPFNPSTTIRFSIKAYSNVKISISDILGRNVSLLVNSNMDTGVYEVNWKATNFSSGVYFYTLYINNKLVSVKKLLLTK